MGEICHFLLLRQNSAKLFLDFCRRDIFHDILYLTMENDAQIIDGGCVERLVFPDLIDGGAGNVMILYEGIGG